MNPFSAIAGLCAIVPGWAWAIAFAMMTAAAGGEAMLKAHYKAEAATQRTALADVKTRAAQAAQAASEAARTEEQRRADAVRKVVTDAQTQTAAARADAVRAAGAADSLRGRVAALVAASRASPKDPAPAGGSAPADPLAMFADVLGRIDDAAGRYAAAADEARGAGLACERYADGLQPDGK